MLKTALVVKMATQAVHLNECMGGEASKGFVKGKPESWAPLPKVFAKS